MRAVIVLGLDPGSSESALVAFDTGMRKPVCRYKVANDAMPGILVSLHAPGVVLVIEQTKGYTLPLGEGPNARSFFPQQVLDTAEWTGYFRRCWEELGGRVEKLDRRAVKMNLLGSVRGGDPQVRAALIDLLGPQGTKRAPGPTYGMRADLWAALAAAFVWHELARGTRFAAPGTTNDSARASPAGAEDDRAF